MPATQRGQAYKIAPGRWGLRYRDTTGQRRRKSPFQTKSAALAHYREHIEPVLLGQPVPMPEITLGAFVDLYLERHAANVRPRTISTLRERLGHATTTFGEIPLRDLERMTDDLAAWRSRQPAGVRYARMGALRQTLAAAVRWGHMTTNPAVQAGQNRQPQPRTVRAFTRAELDAIALELPPEYAPLPAFAAATGMRPEEWQALERRDIDRRAGILTVRRTVSSGEVVDRAKTERSRRQIPLTSRALDALDALPPRLDTQLIFPAPGGALLTSTTGDAACGLPQSRLRASSAPRASTTCAQRSRPMRSRPGSASTPSQGSWARASS